ncbi:hypothetical protein ACLOJK_037194 [Asimina triloba]
MDAYNYQWGYESIYEDDALSAATAELAAWKERLEMNAQVGYEEDVLSTAAAQLAAWKERLEMNDSENESSLEELMAQCIQTQTVSLKNLETLMGQMTNMLAQLSRQPEAFLSNTEPNPRHEDRAQCPSVIVRSEVQPEPQTQNVEELKSSSCSSPNPSPAMPTTQSPCKQPSFCEEKAPQVEIPTFPPMIRYVPPEPNSSDQVIITATNNNVGVEEKPKKAGLFKIINEYIINNLIDKHSSS